MIELTGGQRRAIMKVVILTRYVIDDTEEPKALEIDEGSSIINLFEELDLARPSTQFDHRYYYQIRNPYFFNTQQFPYIIKDGKLLWGISYADVSLRDFFQTFNIQDSRLHVLKGIPQAGGPGYYEVAFMWQQFYDALAWAAPMLGASSFFITITRLLNKLRKNNPPDNLKQISPASIFSLITSRNMWNHLDLAHLLELDEKEAKHLLKTCRFEWNRKTMMYERTRETDSILEKLNKVKWFDGDKPTSFRS